MKAPDKTQAEIIEDIRGLHRQRRYAMKVQQKIDRALEAFVRNNATTWSFDMPEAEREKINREVKAMIAAAREGEGMPLIIAMTQNTDKGREPFDAVREAAEKNMEQLAERLPVMKWIDGVNGAAALGVATIVAESGDLANYSNPQKLWSRLGYAPFDGAAGSTWKRPTWRPRTLTADEWTEHPFNGQRYALMHQISIWLVNAQWIGAEKSESGEGQPAGYYGWVYSERRKHTALTHPDWSKQHSRMDALRVAQKAFLRDLWCVWNDKPLLPRPEIEWTPKPKPKRKAMTPKPKPKRKAKT
jgi:hypothetical protein